MLEFRKAVRGDLRAIVTLLAEDDLGAGREDLSDPVAETYEKAFAAINEDPNQFLAVVELDGVIVGTLQISILHGLSRKGAIRGQIEGVRIARACQGRGVGSRVLAWAIDYCRSKGCSIVQLTSDVSRTAAHDFYKKLGFSASHIGFKLSLPVES